ncbi:hypothetical protein [Haloarchaeobius amylolyticus]|uniref:hypothetical protein n=1 Tax=Haloarchaeobius amylolyticus TaxID=1198296 RepID=UPI00226D5BCE|nr:hypothetical protein [Haloarchaeobius amylolyticus]
MASAELLGFHVDHGTYGYDGQVDTTVYVENTGSSRHTFFVGYTVYGPNGDTYDNDATTGTTLSLDPGSRGSVTVEWDVESVAPEGSYDVRISVWEESDPSNLRTRLADDREYDAFYVQEQTVSATIRSISVDNGTYSAGERVDTDVSVENTGSDSHTFYVGYTVHGPDGDSYDNNDTTGQAVTLDAGEVREVQVEWDVESDAPDGSYDVQVAVWKQSDPDNLVDRLDEVWDYDAFYVQEETVSARVQSIAVDNGTYSHGQRVDTNVGVENTGTETHTFYVGYTVHGPDGDPYDNNDTTGQAVTLDAGEVRDVQVEWDVESAAPEGSYDVQVAVWKQSDPDNLVDRLDEEWDYDSFYVEEAEATAAILDFTPATGEYRPGDTVTSSVTVENTGTIDHTFFVGYTAYDPNGGSYDNDDTTGRTVTLAPGEDRTVSLEWVVPSDVPEGLYDIRTSVWQESDPSSLQTRLDDWTAEDTISIVTESVSARIESTETQAGQFTEGQVVQTAVEVTNTGETDHTFFVGYSVWGPDGNDYDNSGATGRQISILSGETVTVDVEWQVTRSAPTGVYDVEIAIWQESDRDRLETRLANSYQRDVFEVVETLAAGTIDDVTAETETVAGGESLPIEIGVTNDGETSHTFFVGVEPVDPDGVVVTEELLGRQISLASSESGRVQVEWDLPADVPSGSYDLRVRLWSERDRENLDTLLDEMTAEDAVVVDNPKVTITDFVTKPADGEVSSFEVTATATVVLENTGTEIAGVDVEHRITGPDGSLVVSDTEQVEVTQTETQRSSIQWEPSRSQNLSQGRYDYEAVVRSSTDEELVRRSFDRAFSLTVKELGRTDFTLELRESTGDPVERADIDLAPVEGGESFSQQLRNGDVQFDRIPAGLYELTVDHGDALIEETKEVWVSSTFTDAYLTVAAAQVITGSVVDSTGSQPVADATVSLEGVEQTSTDPMGNYSFDRRVPDGTYDIEVEGPDGSTTQRSVTVGPSRHVGLELDRPLVDPQEREKTPSKELISEDNQVVTVFARYLQNTETEDVVLNGYTDLVHGAVKGVVAAIMDIFDSLKETVMMILGLDLEEVLKGVARFIDAIVETRGGIFFDIAKAMIASTVDGIEALHQEQREDNPYEMPNPRAYVFLEGWYFGYIGFNLLLGWVAKLVALGARGVLTASDAMADALDRMTDVVRRFDRGEGSIADPGAVSKFPLLRSQAAKNAPDGLPVGGSLFGGTAVMAYVEAAPHSGILWDIFDSLYRTNHRYLGRMDPDNPAGTFGDPLEDIRKSVPTSGDVGNLAGALAERVMAARFLEGRGDFTEVDKILTDFEPRKLNEGETALLLNWKRQTGSYSAEFDFLEIEMRRMADGEDPKPVVVKNWESTAADDLAAELEKKERTMQKIIDRTNDKGMQTPSASGLSGEAFVRDGIPDVELVKWERALGVSSKELRQLATYIFRTVDPDDEGFKLENLDIDFDNLDFDIDDVEVQLDQVDFLFKPRTTDD